jgi:hypothetical protein
MQTNPYEAPKAPIQAIAGDPVRIEEIASGQKLVIYAILVNIAAIALQLVIGRIAGVLGLVALVMSILGVLRLASGMSMAVASKVLLIVAMFIPLVGLITLLVLNSRATRHLTSAGYKVGLLGASK